MSEVTSGERYHNLKSVARRDDPKRTTPYRHGCLSPHPIVYDTELSDRCQPWFSNYGRKVLFLNEICPVRVSYETDNQNKYLNMMRKDVDVTEFRSNSFLIGDRHFSFLFCFYYFSDKWVVFFFIIDLR